MNPKNVVVMFPTQQDLGSFIRTVSYCKEGERGSKNLNYLSSERYDRVDVLVWLVFEINIDKVEKSGN